MSSIIAVITGDLVASSKADAGSIGRAFTVLSDTARRLDKLWQPDARFTRFRGDGWQIVLREPENALRVCLLMLAALRASDTGLETRLSFGIGRFESLGSRDLSDARGEAFVLSGHGLDTMPRARRIQYGGGPRVNDPWLEAVLSLVDWLVARWSREQAEAVALYLSHMDPTQTELAARLGISRQALKARLDSSGITAAEDALSAFQSADWEIGADA